MRFIDREKSGGQSKKECEVSLKKRIMTHCSNHYSEVIASVNSGACAMELRKRLHESFVTHMMDKQCVPSEAVASLHPSQFPGDVVIVWSGDDFTEYDKTQKTVDCADHAF